MSVANNKAVNCLMDDEDRSFMHAKLNKLSHFTGTLTDKPVVMFGCFCFLVLCKVIICLSLCDWLVVEVNTCQ